MTNLIRTSAAENDLAEIWSYIAADNLKAADSLVTQIAATFDLIRESPEIGFQADEIKPGVRCKPVKRNYLIFYKIVRDDVYILRVLHAARNLENLL